MGRVAYPLAVIAAGIVIFWPAAWPVAGLVSFLALAAHGWQARRRCGCCGGWTLEGVGFGFARHEETCMWWDRQEAAR